MLSPYRRQPSSYTTHTREEKNWNHTKDDLKKTSKELEVTSNGNDESISKKVKTTSNLEGSDPNDNHNQGNILVEQAFSSTWMAEFVENIEKFWNYKTKYHKPLKDLLTNHMQKTSN